VPCATRAGAAAAPSPLMLLQQRSGAVADSGRDRGQQLGEAVADRGHDHGLGGDREDQLTSQGASMRTRSRHAGSKKQAGHAALMMAGLVVLVFSLSTCQCLWATPGEVASKAPSPKAGEFVRRPLRSASAAFPGRSASMASMPTVPSHEQIARSASQPTVTGTPGRKSDAD